MLEAKTIYGYQESLSIEGSIRVPEHFTVRPSPVEGESLTSYILRTAFLNGINPIHIYRLVNNSQPSTLMNKLSYQSDNNPHGCVDMSLLAQLTRLSAHRLERLTNVPLIRKLEPIKSSVQTAHYMETRHRKFCPICIQDKRIFKLLWQVNEIRMCDVHHVELIDDCQECGIPLRYLGPHLHKLKCDSGNHFIDQATTQRLTERRVIDHQLRLYNDWEQLLNPKVPLLSELDVQHPLKSIAAKLLYLSQSDRTQFNQELNVTSLRSEYIFRLRKTVAEPTSGLTKYSVTLPIILRTIRDAKVEVGELKNVQVPDSFVQSILEYPRKYCCLTPWCSSFGSSSNIRNNKRLLNKEKNNIIYTKFSMCSACNIRYGYNTTSQQWESIGNYIDVVQQVVSVLKQGLLPYTTRKEIGISQEKMSKILGYIIRHRLVVNEITERYQIEEISEEVLLRYFRDLFETGGGLLKNARKILGWSEVEFAYYLAHPCVQNYLFFDAKHAKIKGIGSTKTYTYEQLEYATMNALKDLFDRAVKITIRSVAKEVGCSPSVLDSYGLNSVILRVAKKQKTEFLQKTESDLMKQAAVFLSDLKLREKRGSLNGVCGYLGISEGKARKFKKLSQYISLELEKLNAISRRKTAETYKREARRIINALYLSHRKITQESIALELGTTYKYLWKHYPDVLEYIMSLMVEMSYV